MYVHLSHPLAKVIQQLTPQHGRVLTADEELQWPAAAAAAAPAAAPAAAAAAAPAGAAAAAPAAAPAAAAAAAPAAAPAAKDRRLPRAVIGEGLEISVSSSGGLGGYLFLSPSAPQPGDIVQSPIGRLSSLLFVSSICFICLFICLFVLFVY